MGSTYDPSHDTYSQAGTYYTVPSTDVRAAGRRIFGLRASTFWLLLALVVVIVAAAVGGGVGGAMAVNNAKTACISSPAFAAQAASQTSASSSSPSPTPTSSATTSAASSSASATSSSTSVQTTAWGPLATSVPYTGCPGNNNTVYTAVGSKAKFQIVCGHDIPNTGTSDLLNAIVPTFELCMELCGSWNDLGKSNGNASVPCKGAAFIPTHVNGDGGGNPIDCVLKAIGTGLFVNGGYNVDSGILL